MFTAGLSGSSSTKQSFKFKCDGNCHNLQLNYAVMSLTYSVRRKVYACEMILECIIRCRMSYALFKQYPHYFKPHISYYGNNYKVYKVSGFYIK